MPIGSPVIRYIPLRNWQNFGNLKLVESSDCLHFDNFQIKMDQPIGTMYEACQDNNCNYVAKIVALADDFWRNAFFVECAIARYACGQGDWESKNNEFGPYVYSTFTCNAQRTGVIIMNKMDMTLAEYFQTTQIKLNAEEWKKLYKVVHTMHEQGILHGNLTAHNILVKKDDTDQLDFRLINFHLAFIAEKSPVNPMLRRCQWINLFFGQPWHNYDNFALVNNISEEGIGKKKQTSLLVSAWTQVLGGATATNLRDAITYMTYGVADSKKVLTTDPKAWYQALVGFAHSFPGRATGIGEYYKVALQTIYPPMKQLGNVEQFCEFAKAKYGASESTRTNLVKFIIDKVLQFPGDEQKADHQKYLLNFFAQ